MRKRTCTWQAPRRAAYPTNRLKAWRGIATRFDKKPEGYLAGLHLRASMIWIKDLAKTIPRSRPNTLPNALRARARHRAQAVRRGPGVWRRC